MNASRAPKSVLLEEPEVRAAGLADIGDLARTVLAAERPLILRAVCPVMFLDQDHGEKLPAVRPAERRAPSAKR